MNRPLRRCADSNAAKQRRYRQRLARCEVVVEVVVGARAIDLLVFTGYLAERDSHKRARIGEALSRMLAEAGQERYQ